MSRVYCAGPLFHEWERREMSEIASVLETAGYSTFLPHRDGLEFARLLPVLETLGINSTVGDAMLQRAIFSLDVYELLSCSDAVVVNLNGRVPDEGAVVEASLAWHSGKALVLYKTDSRTVLNGSDNPMITGLGDFHVIHDLAGLPDAVTDQLRTPRRNSAAQVLKVGGEIATARKAATQPEAIARMLIDRFGSIEQTGMP